MIELFDARYKLAEQAGFYLERPKGYPSHTFIHFIDPVDILINGEIVHTRPHACVIYRAKTPQKYYSPTPLVNDYIHFNIDSALLQEYDIEFDTVYYPPDYNNLSSIIQELEAAFFSDDFLRNQFLEVKFKEFLIRFSQTLHDAAMVHIDHTTRSQFLALRLNVLTQLDKPWTTKQMADNIGISQSRFYTLYKKIFGCTPNADLIRSRIDRAKSMLALSKEPISSIAIKLGYNNVAHFMRQFKAIVGIAPGQFRKINHYLPNNSAENFTHTFSIATDVYTNNIHSQEEYPEIRRIIPPTSI